MTPLRFKTCTDLLTCAMISCLLAGCNDNSPPTNSTLSNPASTQNVQPVAPPTLVSANASAKSAENQLSTLSPQEKSPQPITQNSNSSMTLLVPDQSATGAKKKEAAEHEYEPPFGERTNLFLPLNADTSSTRKNTRSAGPTIQLKGFARVDQLRVILSLDGRVITLSEGEEKEGIRAVSILPPQVQLQKGRRRWTLTLSKSLGSS